MQTSVSSQASEEADSVAPSKVDGGTDKNGSDDDDDGTDLMLSFSDDDDDTNNDEAESGKSPTKELITAKNPVQSSVDVDVAAVMENEEDNKSEQFKSSLYESREFRPTPSTTEPLTLRMATVDSLLQSYSSNDETCFDDFVGSLPGFEHVSVSSSSSRPKNFGSNISDTASVKNGADSSSSKGAIKTGDKAAENGDIGGCEREKPMIMRRRKKSATVISASKKKYVSEAKPSKSSSFGNGNEKQRNVVEKSSPQQFSTEKTVESINFPQPNLFSHPTAVSTVDGVKSIGSESKPDVPKALSADHRIIKNEERPLVCNTGGGSTSPDMSQLDSHSTCRRSINEECRRRSDPVEESGGESVPKEAVSTSAKDLGKQDFDLVNLCFNFDRSSGNKVTALTTADPYTLSSSAITTTVPIHSQVSSAEAEVVVACSILDNNGENVTKMENESNTPDDTGHFAFVTRHFQAGWARGETEVNNTKMRAAYVRKSKTDMKNTLRSIMDGRQQPFVQNKLESGKKQQSSDGANIGFGSNNLGGDKLVTTSLAADKGQGDMGRIINKENDGIRLCSTDAAKTAGADHQKHEETEEKFGTPLAPLCNGTALQWNGSYLFTSSPAAAMMRQDCNVDDNNTENDNYSKTLPSLSSSSSSSSLSSSSPPLSRNHPQPSSLLPSRSSFVVINNMIKSSSATDNNNNHYNLDGSLAVVRNESKSIAVEMGWNEGMGGEQQQPRQQHETNQMNHDSSQTLMELSERLNSLAMLVEETEKRTPVDANHETAAVNKQLTNPVVAKEENWDESEEEDWDKPYYNSNANNNQSKLPIEIPTASGGSWIKSSGNGKKRSLTKYKVRDHAEFVNYYRGRSCLRPSLMKMEAYLKYRSVLGFKFTLPDSTKLEENQTKKE